MAKKIDRDREIKFMLSDEEYDRFAAVRDHYGTTMSQLIRDIVQNEYYKIFDERKVEN